MGFPTSFKNVEFCTQLRLLPNFDIDKLKADLDEWAPVHKYAFIIHNECQNNDGTPKEPHIHLLLQFWTAVPTESILAHFRKLYGDSVGVQCLEKCKRWTAAIAYLTHENKPDKHLYPRDRVVSNYDFNADADEGKNANKDFRKLEIIGLIDQETMREYNVSDFVTAEEYTQYKRAIEDAFAYVYGRKTKEVNRKMDVMYLSGKAGIGKTTFAKWWCEARKLSYCVSSSANDPLQDYKGQDVLILDDFRPSQWHMTDLLKLLDNHTASSVKSRYHNKYMCYCKMIIITSVVPLVNVWDNLEGIGNEPREQLYRRVGIQAEVSAETVTVSMYGETLTMSNPTIEYFKDKDAEVLRVKSMFTSVGFSENDGFRPDNGQIEMVFKNEQDKRKATLSFEQAQYKDEQKKTKKTTNKTTRRSKNAE